MRETGKVEEMEGGRRRGKEGRKGAGGKEGRGRRRREEGD